MLRSLADRLSGWVVVTLIGNNCAGIIHPSSAADRFTTGITTAIIAFCIIKTETLLFDLKQGYCSANVLAPKKECCPSDQHQNDFSEPHCSEWNTWASVLSERHTPSTKAVRLNFVAYLTVAVRVGACISLCKPKF
jgi:chloride channel 3/4/5